MRYCPAAGNKTKSTNKPTPGHAHIYLWRDLGQVWRIAVFRLFRINFTLDPLWRPIGKGLVSVCLVQPYQSGTGLLMFHFPEIAAQFFQTVRIGDMEIMNYISGLCGFSPLAVWKLL